MARMAQVVAPGVPHHVTQRGNRRQQTFFCQEDYEAYLGLMSEWCGACGVEVWAYCLMPNHTHLIAVPQSAEGLRLAIGKAHLRYSRRINFREGWRGHVWQGRFASYPMDERHALTAARYIETNPVRAGLVARAEEWAWSSAKAHLEGKDDGLAKVEPLLAMVGDWGLLLAAETAAEDAEAMRRHERTGRPLGEEGFIGRLEESLSRRLRRGKPGPKAATQKR